MRPKNWGLVFFSSSFTAVWIFVLVPYFCVWFVRFQFILLVTKEFLMLRRSQEEQLGKVFLTLLSKVGCKEEKEEEEHTGRGKKWENRENQGGNHNRRMDY